MPFKSEAQKRKMHRLLAEGKITQKQFDKMAEGTPQNLPERNAKPGPATKRPMGIK